MADRSAEGEQKYQSFVFPGEIEGLVVSSCSKDLVPGWFCPDHWGDHAWPVSAGGRGAAWFIERPAEDWVLRHYMRGGVMAHLSRTRYVFMGSDSVRSIAEFKMLAELHGRGFPVPPPIAACCRRVGAFYEAAILLERLPGVQPLAEFVFSLDKDTWQRVGAAIRRFHDAGVFHADLNCFNILVSDDQVYLIDFDKARYKDARRDNWKKANLNRLKRSLEKLDSLSDYRLDGLWQALRKGYYV